ncbi:MAG: hypothetical protein Q8O67_21590 [Deltaproteobacteria bacterium]|nr:hypothetical protein [Deltaproteobacteria bacterium]
MIEAWALLFVSLSASAPTPDDEAHQLPAAQEPTAGTWHAAGPAVPAVDVLPMVPATHASRLGAWYVSPQLALYSPFAGALTGVFPTIQFSDLAGAGAGLRIEGGWRAGRTNRFYGTFETGALAPGRLLTPSTTVAVTVVSVGAQGVIADAPWVPTLVTRYGLRLRDQRWTHGAEELSAGFVGLNGGLGLELRLTSDLLLIAGADFWQANIPIYGGGTITDRNGARYIIKNYLAGTANDFSGYVGLTYEFMKK